MADMSNTADGPSQGRARERSMTGDEVRGSKAESEKQSAPGDNPADVAVVGSQPSAKDRDQGSSAPTPRSSLDPGRSPVARLRALNRDRIQLGSTTYRVRRHVGGQRGERAGKNETFEATRHGDDAQVVFIKRFRRPKFPTDQYALASPTEASRIRSNCNAFERRHKAVMSRLADDGVGAGALIKPIDFGREAGGVSFVKVYPFVSVAEVATHDTLRQWDQVTRRRFVVTLLLAVRELHRVGVVHGDLKTDNILIVECPIGPVARLVDFDDAYTTDATPTDIREIGVTILTPEIQVMVGGPESGPEQLPLGTGCDLFQLGVVLHQLLSASGGFPLYETSDDFEGEAADAALKGFRLEYGDLGVGSPHFSWLCRKTLEVRPEHRPSIDELLSALAVKVPS
jgi:serine/threonine protein kinase